jgi:hypothetical protein
VPEDEQLTALAEVDRLLETHEIEYWLFGGWAVDFHAGRVTRAHDDLDLAVWVDDLALVTDLLVTHGWRRSPEAGEDGYTAFARGNVRLELAFLARDEDGQAYTPLRDGGRGEWPAGAFEDSIAELGGVRARVVSLDALRTDKAEVRDDAIVAAKDRADSNTLSGLT